MATEAIFDDASADAHDAYRAAYDAFSIDDLRAAILEQRS
jgi:hypothetical protein